MSERSSLRLARTLGLLLGLSLSDTAHAAPIGFGASGLAAGDIQATVDAFRDALGNPNNGNAPGTVGGRREINWDGGGATTPSPGGTPFTVFQNTRGATMATPGSGFNQAAPADLALQFANPDYTTTFAAFSPSRLFAPIGSNVTEVTFSVPGTGGAVAATVSAFGAVFSDVDTNATTMEFFDAGDLPLGSFVVPDTAGTATFSFLGVLFDAGEQIGRVRIITGNTGALGPTDGLEGADVVVMDDFLYAEPVPEPGTLALLALGLVGLGAAGRRRGSR